MNIYDRVNPGDRIIPSAAFHNATVDAIRATRNRGLLRAGPLNSALPAGVVLVRNDTGADLDRFAVVGLDVPIITAVENLDEFQRQATFSGVTPSSTYTGKFAVLQSGIPNGDIGRAMVSGITPVLLTGNASSSRESYADIGSGLTGSLTEVSTGTAHILSRDDSDTAVANRWGVVRFPDKAAAASSFVGCLLRLTSTQSFAYGTEATVTPWEVGDGYDTSSFFSAGTPDTITFPSTGIYEIGVGFDLGAVASGCGVGNHIVTFLGTAGFDLPYKIEITPTGGGVLPHRFTSSRPASITSGQTIKVRFNQGVASGGMNLLLQTTKLWATRLGAL